MRRPATAKACVRVMRAELARYGGGGWYVPSPGFGGSRPYQRSSRGGYLSAKQVLSCRRVIVTLPVQLLRLKCQVMADDPKRPKKPPVAVRFGSPGVHSNKFPDGLKARAQRGSDAKAVVFEPGSHHNEVGKLDASGVDVGIEHGGHHNRVGEAKIAGTGVPDRPRRSSWYKKVAVGILIGLMVWLATLWIPHWFPSVSPPSAAPPAVSSPAPPALNPPEKRGTTKGVVFGPGSYSNHIGTLETHGVDVAVETNGSHDNTINQAIVTGPAPQKPPDPQQ
jgi:hypothetical protein